MHSQARFALRNLAYARDEEVMRMERELITFCAQTCFNRLSRSIDGVVVSSGTEANEVAALIAKRSTGRRRIIVSNLRHLSLDRHAEKLDMDLHVLDTDKETFKVPTVRLKEALDGNDIAMIVITHGATQLGTSEDFEFDHEIETLVRRKKIWVHIDAAYGGMVMNLAGCNDRAWQTSALVRSLSVSAHKFIGVLGCAALLLTNPKDKKLIGPEAFHFPGNVTALGTMRSAYPLAIAHASMRLLGTTGMKKLAKKCVTKARWVGTMLRDAGLTLTTPIQSSIVPVTLSSEEESIHVREQLLKKGFRASRVTLSARDWRLHGIRIVVNPQPHMTKANLAAFGEALIEIHRGLRR